MCRHVHSCRRGCRAGGWRSLWYDDERFHRVRHVFQAQLAHWVEHQIKPAGHVIADRSRHADMPRGTGHLQPGGDDHAIAVEIGSVGDDVAKIDAHSKDDRAVGRVDGIVIGQCLLQYDRAIDGVRDAVKEHQ